MASPEDPAVGSYTPTMPADYLAQLRRWHDRAYAEQLKEGAVERTFDYLGHVFVVPPDVMPITPMSHLLGEAVLAEVQSGERVLDMGTGSGVNAVLAASRGANVLAVDISDAALAAAKANCSRNGVTDRVEVRRSDVFSAVEGRFDLIVFDPPFRWFKPRSVAEAVMADEGYTSLGRFFEEGADHLTDGGRMLIFFGTSGDLGHLHGLMDGHGFAWEPIARDDLVRDGWKVDYFTFRVTH